LVPYFWLAPGSPAIASGKDPGLTLTQLFRFVLGISMGVVGMLHGLSGAFRATGRVPGWSVGWVSEIRLPFSAPRVAGSEV